MSKHYRRWETFADDQVRPCPEPGCRDRMVGNVHLNGHLVVSGRTCRYCWARFSPAKLAELHCSPTCRTRDNAYDTWVRETRAEAVYSRPGKRAPLAGASQVAAVQACLVPELLDVPA